VEKNQSYRLLLDPAIRSSTFTAASHKQRLLEAAASAWLWIHDGDVGHCLGDPVVVGERELQHCSARSIFSKTTISCLASWTLVSLQKLLDHRENECKEEKKGV
jgi:hypothetical protein